MAAQDADQQAAVSLPALPLRRRPPGQPVRPEQHASFDYNEIVHDVGYAGRSMLTEVSPGNWQMSSTLRSALQTTYDASASAARTYPLLSNLFAPSLAAGSVFDVGPSCRPRRTSSRRTSGLQAAVDRKWGNVHLGYNYSWFTERQDLLVLDTRRNGT